jgi:hypothetical protein
MRLLVIHQQIRSVKTDSYAVIIILIVFRRPQNGRRPPAAAATAVAAAVAAAVVAVVADSLVALALSREYRPSSRVRTLAKRAETARKEMNEFMFGTTVSPEMLSRVFVLLQQQRHTSLTICYYIHPLQ